MTDAHRDETVGEAPPRLVTLTTGRIAEDAIGALAAALGVVGVAVERRAFLPTRDDETSPWGVLLLAVAGPPRAIAFKFALEPQISVPNRNDAAHPANIS